MANAPLYEVISRDLTSQIRSGRLKPGFQLESESGLARRYGVSRMTVRQALSQLELERLVTRRQGAGTFVSEPQSIERHAGRLAPFHEELGLEAEEISTRIISRDVVEPPEDVNAQLFAATGQTTLRLVRVRSYQGRPMAVQTSWLPYLRAPELAYAKFVKGSLYTTLAERFGITVVRATQRISGALATEDQSSLLDIEPGDPVTHISRLAWASTGEPIEVAESFMVPGFRLVLQLER
ncbi:GntR family transcriptional regulator [Paramicrobacterium chengjingii]|uniref:GntR family transcriptional regulator n=1 Tax=Paramicrobacterium chengjingii TaxID=2769067 RepID=A0ABX6YHK2_9MICO|nr:GntR family transcriptional regulator [Microbacterium chengjingii]QPZ38289.1 GntR family transcriptional regulator [Microbacterium chengjingii]